MEGGKQKTILVVDDNEEERDIFSSYLEFVGYRVVTAADGEEGVRQAREHQPDLILLDITMPVLDGWRTRERLELDPGTQHIPVVALTAQHLEEGRLEAAGFCGYLEKPLAPYRVLEEVERCIGAAVTESPPPAESPSPPDAGADDTRTAAPPATEHHAPPRPGRRERTLRRVPIGAD